MVFLAKELLITFSQEPCLEVKLNSNTFRFFEYMDRNGCLKWFKRAVRVVVSVTTILENQQILGSVGYLSLNR